MLHQQMPVCIAIFSMSIMHCSQVVERAGVFDNNINSFDSYSDSENEDGYKYTGYPQFTIPKGRYLCLTRGIHFSPTKFDAHQISQMRKRDDAGKPIYAAAVYDLAGMPIGDESSNNLQEQADAIQQIILDLSPEERDTFQEGYSNNFDEFHQQLQDNPTFRSKQNPQVSTSETFEHSVRYAAGCKYLGTGVKRLKPTECFNDDGSLKQPYLGKVYIILIDEEELAQLAPYFVVEAHDNERVRINPGILREREVSFPACIPGKYVVASSNIRLPSFKGEYKEYYQEKFGLSKDKYEELQSRVKSPISGNFLNKTLLPYIAHQLKRHVVERCQEEGAELVHRDFN